MVQPWIQARVRDGAERLVTDFTDPRDQLAAARHMATMAFLGVASEIADRLIVTYRADHPNTTYEETAADLGIGLGSVNRAVVRFNKREREAA